MLRLIGALLLFALASPVVLAADENLVIRTANGEHRFTVEIAATPQARATGLMHRAALAANAGMLFDFGKVAPVAMWMKDTLIPLDMLFIRADGAIANIEQQTVPQSLGAIASAGPVLAVLEINGGASARLGIRPGDRVLHRLFGASK